MIGKVLVEYDYMREQWLVKYLDGKEYKIHKVFDTTRILDENGQEVEGGFAYVSDELICDLVEAQQTGYEIELTI